MNREELRGKIDEIDAQLIKLFSERMEIAAGIAKYKKENNLPVLDPKREREKIASVINQTPDEFKDYTPILYDLIFELSRSYQNRLIGTDVELTSRIQDAIDNTSKLFPEHATVACQGVEGANSQFACDKLFKNANILFFNNFEAVFSAIEKGLCQYGVIPVENSTAGSVNSVYDLMMRHNFHIVRSIRLKIEHNLLAKPGVKLEDVKETGKFMIEIMPVMFIPAGVGLIKSWAVLKDMLIPAGIITVVTLVTVMVATGRLSQRVIRKERETRHE